MYIAIVALTMFVLPAASIFTEHALTPSVPIMLLVGRWFVFWGVGVRLSLAGLRQFFQPKFTATEIFHIDGHEVLPLVRELGVANVATGAVGLLGLAFASFILPISVSAAIFYGGAGVRHIFEPNRSHYETIAMVSDLFICIVLALFVAHSLMQLLI